MMCQPDVYPDSQEAGSQGTASVVSFQGVLVQLNTGDADQLLRWIEKNSAWWAGRNPSSWSEELRVLEQSMEESNGWAHGGSRCTPRHTHPKCTHTCYLTIRSVDLLTLGTGVPAAGLSLRRSLMSHSPRLVGWACPEPPQSTHPDWCIQPVPSL